MKTGFVALGAALFVLTATVCPVAIAQTVGNSASSSGSSSADAKSGSLSGASSNSGVVNVLNSGGSGAISYSGTYTVKDNPPVAPPSIFGGTNPCTVGVSGGVSVTGFGLGLGGSWSDKGCERRNGAVILFQANMPDVAVALLCEDSNMESAFSAAGKPCPQARAAAQPAPVAMATPAAAPAPARPRPPRRQHLPRPLLLPRRPRLRRRLPPWRRRRQRQRPPVAATRDRRPIGVRNRRSRNPIRLPTTTTATELFHARGGVRWLKHVSLLALAGAVEDRGSAMFGPGWNKRMRRHAARRRLDWLGLSLAAALLLAPAAAWCQTAIGAPPPPGSSPDSRAAFGVLMFGRPPAAEVATHPWWPTQVASIPPIPPHPPGTICVVPNSWCAMGIPGPVRSPCSCPGLYGRTRGSLD